MSRAVSSAAVSSAATGHSQRIWWGATPTTLSGEIMSARTATTSAAAATANKVANPRRPRRAATTASAAATATTPTRMAAAAGKAGIPAKRSVGWASGTAWSQLPRVNHGPVATSAPIWLARAMP